VSLAFGQLRVWLWLRSWLAASYRRFGTTYWSHLQGSSSQRRLQDPLRWGRTGCAKTSVPINKRCVRSQKSEGLLYACCNHYLSVINVKCGTKGGGGMPQHNWRPLLGHRGSWLLCSDYLSKYEYSNRKIVDRWFLGCSPCEPPPPPFCDPSNSQNAPRRDWNSCLWPKHAEPAAHKFKTLNRVPSSSPPPALVTRSDVDDSDDPALPR
jgi:hypothetical protein